MDQDTEKPLGGTLGSKLLAEAGEYMVRRKGVTSRWTKSNNAYMGVYDFPIPSDQSNLYPKFTRVFVTAAMGKILQVLMPTNGDDPWRIGPTPLPDLGQIKLPNGQSIEFTELMRMANVAADGMTRRIRDNMVEMDYDSNLLDAVFDLCNLGSMAWIGPVRSSGSGCRWVADGDDMVEDKGDEKSPRPAYYHVPLRQVYPDPYASRVEDCYSINIRHVVGLPSFYRMADDDKYNQGAVIKYIEQHPKGDWTPALDGWEGEVKAATDQPENSLPQNRFVVWERYGWIDGRDLEEAGLLEDGQDPSRPYMCQTWHVGGQIIRHDITEFYKHPPMIITPYEKIDGSIFGRGVAEQMDDPQSASASLVRAMIDNLAHGVAPITEVDMDLISPEQAKTLKKITPRMIIQRRQKHPDVVNTNRAVTFTNVPVHLDVILPALGFFKEMMQLQTSLPYATQNLTNQASGIRTIGQQQDVNKSMENFIRLVITNIDQKFMVPMLRGFYRWEMEYNEDKSIKGDYQIKAMGVRGALAREVAIQRKLEMMQIASQNQDMARKVNLSSMSASVLRDLGTEDEGLFYTAAESAQIQEMEAQAEAKKQGMVEQARYKAAAPLADMLVQMATSTKPTENPAWAAQAAEAYRAIGKLSPQLEALFSGMAEAQAKEMLAKGIISMQQAAAAAKDFGATGEPELISTDEMIQPPPAVEDAPPEPNGEVISAEEGLNNVG